MLHKVIGIIKRANRPNGFQAYMNNVQRGNQNVGPTYDEARKDYQSFNHQA
ncbi:MAG: hypothetical protein QF898_16660 [SAR202 cluster bacterium]|jgi:hypothetical protein|nr:hypothetical protein [SAR202 cluster bacterium]MDP6513947.1 hypothetical protein [SAR202 cluster bacterium]MDP6715060.1 hypothetical protein [SAR202 cluster bacterium]